MSRKQVCKTIDDVSYRLTMLGGETVSELGFEFTEAVSFKTGLARVLKKLRDAYAASTEVQTAGLWVPLVGCVGWWDDKIQAHGQWLAWCSQEGGLADFLLGMVKNLPPPIQAQLASLFRGAPIGISIGSSSPSASESPPAQS